MAYVGVDYIPELGVYADVSLTRLNPKQNWSANYPTNNCYIIAKNNYMDYI